MSADNSLPIQSCAACGAEVDVADLEPLAEVECPVCGTPMVVAKTIGPYDLVEVMGRGGMGVVYRAIDHHLDRQVALKVLRIDYSADADFIQKLEVEAAITGGINHPHVVKVYTTGSTAGRFFIAMELVDKGTLDDLMEIQGRIAEAQALEIASQISQGLRAASSMGLIHRDVKPGNILFADSHSAKIVDFGLAILEEASAGTGEIWGTPYYVSPERLDRKPEDFRSDMYSLGATIFHAIAGRPPFEAEDAGLVALKHLKSQAVSLQSFAPWVAGSTAFVINRMLQKDPNARYGSYDELISQLEYARTQLSQKASQPGIKSRVVLESEAERKLWGNFTIAVLALIVVLGIGAGAYFLFFAPKSTSDEGVATMYTSVGAVGRERQFDAARASLLAGKPAEAVEKFRSMSTNAQSPQPLRQWAMVHEALAALLNGDLSQARKTMSALKDLPFASKDPDDQWEVNYFPRLADIVLADEAPASNPPDPAKRDPENLFPRLLGGLKELERGSFDTAASELRAFVDGATKLRQADSKKRSEFAWIADYRPLVEDDLTDLTTYRGATLIAKSAQDPKVALEKLKGAKAELQRAAAQRGKTPNATMLAKLDAAIHEAEQRDAKNPPPPPPPPPPPAKPSADQERSSLKEARDKVPTLATDWRFKEASDPLNQLAPTDRDVRREMRTLLRKLSWLRRFKEALIKDLAGGYSGPGEGGSGTISVGKATEEGMELSPGAPITPWAKIDPALILNVAEALATKAPSPTEAAERRWGAGTFAAMTGRKDQARKLLLEAVKATDPAGWPGDQLPLLMPLKPAALAKGKAVTASSESPTETARNAVDGDHNTCWTSAAGSSQWLRVDLGKEYTITKWELRHANSHKDGADANTFSFSLQRSSDDRSWSDVDVVADNTLDVTTRSIPPFNARYVRVLITKPSRLAANTALARIYEFELFGAERRDVLTKIFDPSPEAWLPRLKGTDIGLGPQDESGSHVAEEKTGLFTIRSTGSGFGGESDSFHFLHEPQSGDTKVEVRVDDVEKGGDDSQAGVMVRQGTAPNAKACFLGLTANGDLVWQIRRDTGAPFTEIKKEKAPGWPCGLRLTREGNTVQAEYSTDLKEWKKLGDKETLDLGNTAEAGVAATAHGGKASTAHLEVLHLAR